MMLRIYYSDMLIMLLLLRHLIIVICIFTMMNGNVQTRHNPSFSKIKEETYQNETCLFFTVSKLY